MGTRHPFTTSYDNSAYGTQAGESSGPDDKSSLRGADEHSFEHPARSCLRDRCGHAATKRAGPSPRRIDELHEYYKKETERKHEADRKGTLISMEVRNSMIRDAQKETAHYKTQFENAMSLVETQKLSIKMLQDELGKSEDRMKDEVSLRSKVNEFAG